MVVSTFSVGVILLHDCPSVRVPVSVSDQMRSRSEINRNEYFMMYNKINIVFIPFLEIPKCTIPLFFILEKKLEFDRCSKEDLVMMMTMTTTAMKMIKTMIPVAQRKRS